MTLIIDKNNSKNTERLLSDLLKKKSKKGNLTKYFGVLKRDIDGLQYQMEIRENEN
jgi:CRISPR/Cas system-associated protein Cas10 (large subunit of type III CRISPR-Cas system)